MSTKDRALDPLPHLPIDHLHHFAVIYAEWNQEITHALRDGCMETLKRQEVDANHISLGCVIQGETRHFDFICQAVANGLTEVGIRNRKPVIFGVLTTNTKEQALARAGGELGNKGSEAAEAALLMLEALRK